VAAARPNNVAQAADVLRRAGLKVESSEDASASSMGGGGQKRFRVVGSMIEKGITRLEVTGQPAALARLADVLRTWDDLVAVEAELRG
jgi:hypothetical protein